MFGKVCCEVCLGKSVVKCVWESLLKSVLESCFKMRLKVRFGKCIWKCYWEKFVWKCDWEVCVKCDWGSMFESVIRKKLLIVIGKVKVIWKVLESVIGKEFEKAHSNVCLEKCA